jgi:hypothetical protein
MQALDNQPLPRVNRFVGAAPKFRVLGRRDKYNQEKF